MPVLRLRRVEGSWSAVPSFMGIILALGLCVLALLVGLAQSTFAAAPKKSQSPGTNATWIKRFPPVYLDTAWSATTTRDGNVVVGIQTLGRELTPNYMVFAKLSPDGKLIWQQRLPNRETSGSQTCELPMKLREATDGTLLTAGTRCRDTWPRAWFARLDAKANPIWQVVPDKRIPIDQGPLPIDTYGWDIVEWGSGGGFLGLALGFGGQGSLWMLDISPDGQVTRSRSDFNALITDEFWWGVTDGGRTGEGVRVGFTTGSNLPDVRIGWLDRNLQFRDEASVTGPGREEMRVLDASPDGGFCALLTRSSDGIFLNVERHAADGAQIWRHVIDFELGSRLLALRDGGCVVSGGLEAAWGEKILRLRKYGADGEVVWNQVITGAFSPKSLVETPAGGLVITGYEIPPDRQGSVAYVLHIAPGDLGKENVKPSRR